MASEVKHEYLRGEVWAMAGGTLEHSGVSVNVVHELRLALRSRPCVVYNADARVRGLATDRTTYPDVTVVCGPVERSPDDPHAITNPLVIVELLSDSTGADDRGEKFAHYRRIPSLGEYVMVSQRWRRIEVDQRPGDVFVLTEAGPGGSVRLALRETGPPGTDLRGEPPRRPAGVKDGSLAALDVTLAVDDVYRDPLAER